MGEVRRAVVISVWYGNSIEEDDIREWLYGEMADAGTCFLCFEPLSFPMVMWSGSTGSIYLHEHCASSFVLKLARDCLELEKARSVGAIDEAGCRRD